jgi:hypothetical protein
MDCAVSLEYPKGRTHEVTVSAQRELRLGDEFEMFGRHWRADRILRERVGRGGWESRMACVPVATIQLDQVAKR